MADSLFRIPTKHPIYISSKQYESTVWSKMQIDELQYGTIAVNPLVEQYKLKLLFGDSSQSFLEQLQSRYGEFPVCLSLGCGSGYFDIPYLESGLVKKLIGMDLSDTALNKFHERTREKYDVETRQEDINFIHIEPDHFDLILVQGAMHHLINLEHIFNQIYRGLKENGIFILYEYVGPNKYQWDEATVRIVNAIGYYLSQDFPDLRKLNVVNRKYLKWFSPFEAVFSADIIPVLKQFFEIKHQAIYGPILAPLSGCFDLTVDNMNEPRFIKLLGEIIKFDEFFRREGILGNNIALLVLSKKLNVHAPATVPRLSDDKIQYHIGLEFSFRGLLQKYIARSNKFRKVWLLLKQIRNKLYRF